MPAYTLNETTKLFLTHIWELIKYWNLQDVHDNKKLEGLAFSISANIVIRRILNE